MAEDEFDETQEAPMAPRYRSGGSWGRTVLIVIIVLVIFFGGWFVLSKTTGIGFMGSGDIAQVSGKAWQAVFLTNGQVYFGKVRNVTSDTLALSDIYYLQVVTKPLQGAQPSAEAAAGQQELTLVKLGNEIHGPQDYMVINRDQVMLTEKLKDDSRVVKAINDYLGSQQK